MVVMVPVVSVVDTGGVVRLGALAARVAVVQDGERGADGAGRRGGAEPAAAARVHSHLVGRQRDGQRGGVGLQQSPARQREEFHKLFSLSKT